MDKITDCEYKASRLFLTSLACDFVYFRAIRGYSHTGSLSSLKAALCQTLILAIVRENIPEAGKGREI